MNQAQVDFQQLRIKHILFKSKVRSVVYGGRKDEAFFSRSGPLGLWFSAIGRSRYASLPEMQELLRVQQDLDSAADQLFRLYGSGKIEEALAGLQKIEERSVKFLELLSKLEERVSVSGDYLI
ncbi:histidine kinase [Pontibacter anaerobius]|uniref:Histidine kinase n=1 Tax=Pontibacter anaerobius TaxID=2993940 RepID=A0ABT3RLA2_9BACT|nr:histidine kinase [Pontibacter anaerobius]MCX2742072.1 histidine kinase [Pontibacter anaerobius]